MILISIKMKNLILKYFSKYFLFYSSLSLSSENIRIFIFILFISIYIFTSSCSKVYRSKLISTEKMKELDFKIRSSCNNNYEDNIEDIEDVVENIKIINKKNIT